MTALRLSAVTAAQGGTLGASDTSSFFKITGTWNDASTNFNGALLVNVTSTNSGSNSLLGDFQTGGTSQVSINKTGTITSLANIKAGNASALGWSGRTTMVSGTANGDITFRNDAATNSFTLSAPQATATPALQLGNLDAAVAVAQIIRVQSVVAGTAAANGANFTIIGSLPTGTGTSGDIIFQTGVKTGSGTTQGTATTALTIKGESQTILIASGKSLQLGNSATTGLTAGVLAALTNATIVITDASGQAYRIPCII